MKKGANKQEMNEGSKLSGLSYKELQALALKYKIPGNIRKHLLIKVLRAVNEGNDLEVGRILHELRQNRKKRGKKTHRGAEKIFNTTPLLNYNPEFYGDIHYCRNPPQIQYQWIAGEEEVRESPHFDVNREQIPSYEEFHQLLSGGIQQGYSNERSQSPTIVDLRINSGRIDKWDNTTGIDEEHRSTDVINYQVSTFDRKNYKNTDITDNIQQESSRLLKKMLQAPAGTNLKQFASYETVYHTPSMHNYNIFDDSDTLTADSGSNVNFNQIDGEYKWVENVETNILKNTGDNNIEHYRLYHNSSNDIIENCQKWLANSSYIDNINNTSIMAVNTAYQDGSRNINSKVHNNSMSYYHTDDQSWSLNIDQKYGNEYQYENQNQNQYQCHIDRDEEMAQTDDVHRAHDKNDRNVAVANTQNYFHELISGRELTQPFALSRMHSVFQNREAFQTLCDGNVTKCADQQQYEKCDSAMTECQNHEGQNYIQYTKYGKGEYFDKLSENYTPDLTKLGPFCEPNLVTNGLPVIEHDTSNGYWPQWTSSNDGSNLQLCQTTFRLENLLNLQTLSYQQDHAKPDQTACVYCYTTPIVTQRIFSTSSS